MVFINSPTAAINVRMEEGFDYISNTRALSAAELAASDAFFPPISGSGVSELIFAVSSSVGRVRVSVWRGDITTLRVDAVVNAANAAGKEKTNKIQKQKHKAKMYCFQQLLISAVVFCSFFFLFCFVYASDNHSFVFRSGMFSKGPSMHRQCAALSCRTAFARSVSSSFD